MNILEFQTKHENLFFTRKDDQIYLEEYCPKLKDQIPCLRPVRIRFRLSDSELEKRLDLLDKALSHKRIIVCDGHYSTTYYKADTTEEIGLACIKILKRSEYSYLGSEPRKPSVQKPKFDLETDLGSNALNSALEKEWNDYKNDIVSYEESLDRFNDYHKAMESDYVIAYRLLERLSERIQIEVLQ